jgi:hypothetical protein
MSSFPSNGEGETVTGLDIKILKGYLDDKKGNEDCFGIASQ